MGSPPLVALGLNPQPDLLSEMGKLSALRSSQQQQEFQRGQMGIQQQQLQAQQLENEQRKQQVKDQKTVTELYVKNNGNLDQTIADAAKAGVRPETLQGLQLHNIDVKGKIMDLVTKQGAQAQAQADLMQGAHNAVSSAKAEERPAVYQQQLAGLKNAGVDTSQFPQQYPGDEPFKFLGAVVQGAKQQIEQASKQAEIQKNVAQAGQADAETALKQQEMATGGTGAMADAKYRNILMQQKLGKPVSPEDQAFLSAYTKQKTLVPSFNFNLQAQGVGGGGNPPAGPDGKPVPYADAIKSYGAKGGIVSSIIEGRQAPPAAFALKSPYWQDVMQKVYALDPQFNEQRAQLRKSYAQDKEIGAINTALGHVGVMNDAIDALNNNDTKLLNTIGNRLGVEFGTKAGDAAAMFKTIVHRVGPELSKAYVGAGGSAGERGSDEKDFDESLAPSILKTNVGITAKLLGSKIASKANQWDVNKSETMPTFADRFIMPEAKKVLDRLSGQGGAGGKSGTIRARDPQGKLHEAPAGTPLPQGWKLE